MQTASANEMNSSSTRCWNGFPAAQDIAWGVGYDGFDSQQCCCRRIKNAWMVHEEGWTCS